MRGGVQAVQAGPEVLGGKTAKHQKTRKTLRNCMASLLRSNSQDFVQEVPVGQMAQGTPFRCLPSPQFFGVRKGKGEVTSQVSNTPPRLGGFYSLLLRFLFITVFCDNVFYDVSLSYSVLSYIILCFVKYAQQCNVM